MVDLHLLHGHAYVDAVHWTCSVIYKLVFQKPVREKPSRHTDFGSESHGAASGSGVSCRWPGAQWPSSSVRARLPVLHGKDNSSGAGHAHSS
ncbi:hypothetical protein CEXT_175771 [Caerostris extrusa]|uniref:Uncharacterized protein n=1 Tax=Caerostris extrusa TaxID=172846 RepID=A0AAV4MCF2_CAEEX|nr:hypothetical protein CEXT_175771 [Caerostris extrusa]